MREEINTSNAPKAIGPYTQAIKANGMLFLSGQIALIPDTMEMNDSSIETETNQVLDNLTAVLKEGGCAFNDVIRTEIFLKDMNDFAVVNKLYEEKLEGVNPKPARFTVEVARLPKDARIEISLVAVCKD
ncbi:reactive intermediate/imine deaminase [archaeon D22]|nr:reactive intermediate/imine deaminase [archaeon D22]